MALSAEHLRILDRFPPLLRALVMAELEAGNAIIDAGAGHPAPPAGDMIKLAGDLRTPTSPGLQVYARDSSTHHTEITDATRFFFVLTAPHEPPPLPDMDAIREAHRDEPLPAPKSTRLPGTIELDYRGEMLIYRETERITDIIWTWSQGNHFYRSSLTHWWYPNERRSVPLTEVEKEDLLQTFLDFGHAHIGSSIQVVD
jgi:hypothetical protein